MKKVLLSCLCLLGLASASAETYELITSTDGLEAGQSVIIASQIDSKWYAMKSNSDVAIVITVTDNKITTVPSGVAVYSVENSNVTNFPFAFKDANNDNKYFGNGTNSNKLNFSASCDAGYAFSFNVAPSGNARNTLTGNGTNGKTHLYCNKNNGNPIFRIYGDQSTASYLAPQIFKLVEGDEPPVATAPVFTKQPVGASYRQGATATALTVVATGYPAPTYQWYSNTTDTADGATEIADATSASYTPSTEAIGTTYYFCKATNTEGWVNSDIAAIEVTAYNPSFKMIVAKFGEKYYAMSCNKGTSNNSFAPVEVEVVDGKVQVAPDADIDYLLWDISLPNIESKKGGYLYNSSSTNLWTSETPSTTWEWKTDNAGQENEVSYFYTNNGRTILLQINGTTNCFRAYAPSNIGATNYSEAAQALDYEVAVPKLGEIEFSHAPGAYHTGHKVTISCKNATHLMIGVMKGDLSGMMLTDGEEDPAVPSVENIVVNGDSYSFTINHKEAPHVMIAGVRAFIMPGEYDEDTATDVKEYDPFDNEDLEDGLHVYSAIIPTNDTFCAGTYTGAEGTPLINVDGSTTHSGNTSEATSLVGRTFYGANVDLTFAFDAESSTYPTSYGDEVRMYSGDSFTVTPDPAYKLLKVVIYTTANSVGGTMTAKTGDKEVGTVSGDGNGAGTITWTVEKVKEDNKPVTFTAGSSLRFSHIVVTAVDGTTGIEGIEGIAADKNAPVEYYNLQGVRVENPAAGLYIMRQGSKAVKVLVK